MSRTAEEGFPWLHLYSEALAAGLDARTFWASSPRAVYLLIRERRRRTGTSSGASRHLPLKGKASGRPARVRLNRLPHP